MQLLISLVREDEIEPAVAGGADIIDVKQPREGSLGAGLPHVIRRARELTPAHIPVSAAIGDMPNLPGTAALAAAGAADCGVQYVKVGLMGTRTGAEAEVLLSEVCRAVHDKAPTARVMATAYADARSVGSLPPSELPQVASKAGAYGCMIDTARKQDGTLLSIMPTAQIAQFIAAARELGLLCALAGSLHADDMQTICELQPDVVGFRGAACRGTRADGTVDSAAVAHLKHLCACH